MERVVPFVADTGGAYKQLLAAEQTAQLVQTWIQEKEYAICTIRRQVWELGQNIPYSAVDGHIKQLEEDIGGFKRLLDFNEASCNHWRGLHMAAWRATVRPLKVLDMPNEILMKIFANFQDDPVPHIQVHGCSFDDPLPSPDIASIRNVRLTCRTFCEVASEILLSVVNISFTRASLQRLEEISSHPSISKSVRVLRLHANPYNPSVANYRPCFGEEAISELCNLRRASASEKNRIGEEIAEVAGVDGMTFRTQMLKSRKLQHEAASRQTGLILATLRSVLYETELETWQDTYEGQISRAIDEAREEYGRRSLEQQSHISNPHVLANIINALTKMPNVQQLSIPDEGSYHWDHIFRSGKDKRLDAQKYAAGMSATNPFWDLMVHGGYRDESLFPSDEEPLLPLLHKLPSVLQVPNENLTRLDIILPPLADQDSKTLAEQLGNLRHSFQSLKFVQIAIVETYFGLNSRDSDTSLALTYSLLEAILVSPRLEVVKLDYRMRGKKSRPLLTDESIGSVLANLPWKTLRSLCLNTFSVQVEELRQILQNVSGVIHLELNRIMLLEGTWAEALEILRGRADSSTRVVNPRGEEMIHMSKVERRHFLSKFNGEGRDDWVLDQQCPGPASFYIRGGNIPNPLIRGDD